MNPSSKNLSAYLHHCEYEKNLSVHTIRAYTTDLQQFMHYNAYEKGELDKPCISKYISLLHTKYKPKTVKRKIASLKAFCTFLLDVNLLESNPFDRVRVSYKDAITLPKTVPINVLEKMLRALYADMKKHESDKRRKSMAIREIAVMELLFATGIRVSELCSLHPQDVDLSNGSISIWGKGSRERLLQIENAAVLQAIEQYCQHNAAIISDIGFLFVNACDRRLTEQSVRAMLTRLTKRAGVAQHVTPHMIRHSFATLLLEADVDIRYIQRMLGHSSITTTQVYTHVALAKQREILALKHPRNKMNIDNT